MARYRAGTRTFHMLTAPEPSSKDRKDSGVHLDEPSSPPISEMISVPISTEEKLDMHGSGTCSKEGTNHRFFTQVVNQSKSFNSVFDCDSRMKEQYSDCKMDQLINHTKNLTINKDVPKTMFVDKKTVNVSIDDDQGVDMHEHDADDVKSGFYLPDAPYAGLHSDSENRKLNTNGRGSPVNLEHTKASKVKETKRRKFRNLIPVLRRSQSCGSEAQLVPDHALFLKYDPAENSVAQASGALGNDSRRMIHKTCSADSAMMAAEGLPLDPQDVLKHKHKSSLAKNMRRKFQKLKRGNTDSLLGTAFTTIRGGLTKITQSDALQWGSSFEALLRDKNGLEMFKNFLKSEFSEENIEFWIACEDFKTVRTNKLMVEAKKIYSHYIAIKAPKQVNLDSKTRLDTVTNLENPTRDMFKEAQKRIQFLMENDSYKRFLDSEQYRLLLRRHSGVEER